MFYQSIKHRKACFIVFRQLFSSGVYSQHSLEMAENIFHEEIPDTILSQAAESVEESLKLDIEEEEAKKVNTSRFVELSEDDLDVIVDRAEAQATKSATKWGVKIFEGKHTTRKNYIFLTESFIVCTFATIQALRNVNRCNDKQNG